MRRRRRRGKQLLDGGKEKRRYWKYWRRKHWFALCGELALEEVLILSQGWLNNELATTLHTCGWLSLSKM